MAPFAFLGPEDDGKLKEAYTTISDKRSSKVPSPPKLLLNLGRIEAAASDETIGQTTGAVLRREHAAGHRRGTQ